MSVLISSARLPSTEVVWEKRAYAYGVVYTIAQSLSQTLLSFSSAKQMCKFLPGDFVFFLSMFLAFTLLRD